MSEEIQTLEIVPSGAAEAMERAQIDVQISTARRYPRNITQVKARMLSIATLDEETAAGCFYSIPRGGKMVTGPSVRLAEIAMAAYGNVKAATRIVAVDAASANPHAVVASIVHDLENNVVFGVEKRRRITAKKSRDGTRKAPDDDDIQLAVNAGSAIAFRDAVFKVVPLALVKPVLDQARKVAVGDVKSLAKKRDQVLSRLRQMGLTEERIFGVVGVSKAEEIDVDRLENLIGLGTALKDGNTTLEEAFPPVAKEPAKPIFATAPKVAPKPEPEQDDGDVGPVTPQPEPTPAVVVEPAPAPAPAPAPPLRDELAEVALTVTNFDGFRSWAIERQYDGADTWASFADVPSLLAEKLVKARVGFLNALRAHVQGGAR